MYNKISKRITEKFVELGIIDKENIDIYKYGFELLLSLMFTTLCILILSIFVKKISETVIYLVGFFVVRTICGGYHAKHHYSCFITTIISYLLFLLFEHLTKNESQSKFFIVITLVFSIVIIAAFSPIEHPDNPMTEYRKIKNRRLGFILIFVLSLCLVSSLFFHNTHYIFSFASGIFIASLAILAAKIEKYIISRKEVKQ